ncbi:class B sortase [Eubacterium ruminantium]|uniref:class B sortase n=1 Tax=Eubacterium ruminantium TaxID=42322 RepID=UPI001569CA21|nr:class B sortase [Eubacterium ruminantium]
MNRNKNSREKMAEEIMKKVSERSSSALNNDELDSYLSNEKNFETEKLTGDKRTDERMKLDSEIDKILNDMSQPTETSAEKNKKLAEKMAKEAKLSKKKSKNKIYNILIALFAAVFLFSAGYIGLYYYRTYKNEKRFAKVRGMVVDVNDSDLPEDAIVEEDKEKAEKKLFAFVNGVKVQYKYKNIFDKNNDFIGWLKIPGTNIDYPVMYTPDDEEYYLRRDFNKDYSIAGTLFVSAHSTVENPSDNIIIYGHHMKTKTMFRELVDYEDEDFYKSHKYINFNTIFSDNKYEVIAAFKTNIKAKDDTSFKYYKFFNAASKEEFDEYVSNVKSLTPYNIPVTAEYGDKLITLSTCSYHTDDGRFVVVAKRIED